MLDAISEITARPIIGKFSEINLKIINVINAKKFKCNLENYD